MHVVNHVKHFLTLTALLCLISVYPPSIGAVPIQWCENGHFYDIVDEKISWDSALNTAAAMSYLGMKGHLVTVTSARENQWITDTFGAERLNVHWLGGVQTPGASEPAGGWGWITGETWDFENWMPGEPNNFDQFFQANEDALIFDHGVTAFGKSWNDIHKEIPYASGFVVEYEGDSIPVPEPTTLGLFSIGLGFLGWRHYFRKRRTTTDNAV